jgi:hypothetical protein
MIEIDGIGTFEPGDFGLTRGRNYLDVPALGVTCRFMLEGYEGDSRPDDFRDAMIRFVALRPQVLIDASRHVYAYYSAIRNSGWGDPPEIPNVERVWDFVDFGTDAIVSRRGNGDDRIYISLECGCAWEREHGLQIVFREGSFISKVGQFDGHVSNADAFADPSLEDTVYAP